MNTSRLRRLAVSLALSAAVVAAGGCGLLRPMALKAVANTLSGPGGAINSYDDPETVRGAMDFALITNESLLASIPKHEPLLVATCSQYTQYAFGFIQPDAEAMQWDDFGKSQEISARAFRLAVRGRDYCWRALEVRFKGITAALKTEPEAAAQRARRDQVPLLYWSAASLGASISLGGMDHPELLIDWPVVRALAERALALDETWNRAALHELMITVESQGEAMGGSEERARKHFARAVEVQQGLSPGPYVALAMGIAKANQNYDEFKALLTTAIEIDPDKDPANRLPTLITQQRARVLLAHIDDIILR
jgi:hypothetical protein